MRTTLARTLVCCGLLGATFGAPALALGPIDGEVSAVWWANDLETKSQGSSTSADAGAPGLEAQLWMLNRYGLRATRFGSDPDGADGADYTSLDLMWRAFSPTANNFVAFGVGWQEIDLEGLAQETSGPRLALEGRVSLVPLVYAYGKGSYLPALDDVDAVDPLQGRFEDLDGYEYELGVAWKAAPFVSVHAGYRVNSVSFDQRVPVPGPGFIPELGIETSSRSGPPRKEPLRGSCPDCETVALPAAPGASTSGEAESSGFFLGLGIRF